DLCLTLAVCFFIAVRRRLRSTLFPYTTLFRSHSGSQWRRPARRCRWQRDRVRPQHEYGQQYPREDGCFHPRGSEAARCAADFPTDRKSTRLNSSHRTNSYAVFSWKKKKTDTYK